MNIYTSILNHPHYMNEEDRDWVDEDQFNWLPGFDQNEDSDGEYGLSNENNIKLFLDIEQKAKVGFQNAMVSLKPLFESHYFNNVFISIDLIGLLVNGNTLACYNFRDSDPQFGNYYFDIGWRQINSEAKDYVWEHELLHLLDHRLIDRISIYRGSKEIIDIYRYYLLKYREEGFAELYYLLKGKYDNIDNIDKAVDIFRQNITNLKNQIDAESVLDEKILKSYDFYELGPWIMLDLLRTHACNSYEELINETLEKLYSKQIIEESKIQEIIKAALNIDHYFYLEYCTKLIDNKNEKK